MPYRVLSVLCLLSLTATAQNTPTEKPRSAAPQQQQGAVPKGRPQPVEHHRRTTWHYHSGPKRNAIDSNVVKPAPADIQKASDAGK